MLITRRLEFDAGHRVYGHESKCAHLHGHRYVAEVTVSAPELDNLGRVIDFSVLKSKIGGWVDENWDHNMLLHPGDPLTVLYLTDRHDKLFGGKAPFIMPTGQNPTAENIASFLFFTSRQLLQGTSLEVERVRIYETPNCWADMIKPS